MAADQRNLTMTVSIADTAADVENDLRKRVNKLAQTPDVSARMVHTVLMRTCSS